MFPTFVLFVSFVVKTFFLIWLWLCRAWHQLHALELVIFSPIGLSPLASKS